MYTALWLITHTYIPYAKKNNSSSRGSQPHHCNHAMSQVTLHLVEKQTARLGSTTQKLLWLHADLGAAEKHLEQRLTSRWVIRPRKCYNDLSCGEEEKEQHATKILFRQPQPRQGKAIRYRGNLCSKRLSSILKAGNHGRAVHRLLSSLSLNIIRNMPKRFS